MMMRKGLLCSRQSENTSAFESEAGFLYSSLSLLLVYYVFGMDKMYREGLYYYIVLFRVGGSQV
jgi:hypothetical protein